MTTFRRRVGRGGYLPTTTGRDAEVPGPVRAISMEISALISIEIVNPVLGYAWVSWTAA